MRLHAVEIAVLAILLLSGVKSANGFSSEVTLVDDTGLPKSRYSIWILGYSTGGASPMLLTLNASGVGQWVPVTQPTGKHRAIRLGTGPNLLSRIRFDSSAPVVGGRMYVVLVPVGASQRKKLAALDLPCVTFFNGGRDVVQPHDPGVDVKANVWDCNSAEGGTQTMYLYQPMELTQPADTGMTINIQVVDNFVFPMTMTLKTPPKDSNYPSQIGQPLTPQNTAPDNVNRATVFQLWNDFIAKEPLSADLKNAYLELLTKSGTTPGYGGVQIPNGILSPKSFLALNNAATQGSALVHQYDAVVQALFTPGNIIGLIHDKGKPYLKGTAIKDGDETYFEFLAYDEPNCASLNPDHHYRVFSPTSAHGAKKPNWAPFQIFGNAGVFADVSNLTILSWTGPTDAVDHPATVKALQRDIVSAMMRGIVLLPTPPANVPPEYGCNGEHTKYWSEQTNWYPKEGTYNHYARFMHVAKFSDTQQLYVLPPNAVKDAQDAIMGQSYGFPFDETVHSGASKPNVPSKFEGLPDGAKLEVRLGTFGKPNFQLKKLKRRP